MRKPFSELRERLLRAGVPPRHVRRYLAELADHLADLKAEEESAGRGAEDAESAAFVRLGGMEDLAKAMIEQRQSQSWCVRAPWAMFGVAPLLCLAGVWFVALFLLWSGWQIFLPGADTPFVPAGGPIYGLANIYFQADRALYFGAPIVIGWGIALMAIRQRVEAVWPTAGLILVASMGGTAEVHASRMAIPGGLGHIRMDFTLAASDALSHALVIFSLTVLPYLIWRLQKARPLSA